MGSFVNSGKHTILMKVWRSTFKRPFSAGSHITEELIYRLDST